MNHPARRTSRLQRAFRAALVFAVTLPPLAMAVPRTWESVGPWGHEWGSIVSTANPNVLYWLTDSGLKRSDNQGSTWRGVSPLALVVLSVDPRDARRLLGGLGPPDYRVVESKDGGYTFRDAYRGLEFQDERPQVIGLARSPADADVVLAATEFGLFRRVRSSSWSLIAFGGRQVRSIAIDPSSPGSWVVNVVDPGPTDDAPAISTFLRTDDEGVSWSVMPAVSRAAEFVSPNALFFDPVRPHRLYLNVNCVPYAFAAGAWQPLPRRDTDPTCAMTVTQGGSFLRAWLPHRPLWLSDDGGLTWKALPLPDDFVSHLAVPAPGVIAISGGRGIWKSTDAGVHWKPSSAGISGFIVLDAQVASDAASTVYASLSGEGVFRSRDRGGHWRRIARGLGADAIRAPTLALDPSQPGTLWAGGDELHVSHDGGDTWSNRRLPGRVVGRQIEAVFVDPVREGRAYVRATVPAGVGTVGRVSYRTEDDGESWERLTLDYVAAVAPSDGTLYAEADGLFASQDGGSTWRRVGPLTPWGYDFAVDPSRSDVLWTWNNYIGTVARSVDGGRSFERLAGPYFPLAYSSRIVFNAEDADHPYIATDDALGVTQWSGRKFATVGPPGSVPLAAGPIAIDPVHGYIYAGTSGRGIFRFEFATR